MDKKMQKNMDKAHKQNHGTGKKKDSHKGHK